MLVPMSQATIQVFLCTASVRRQLCHFRTQIALGWNWLSRVEMQEGMIGGRVGFLFAGLREGVRCILEKVIFRPAFFFFACCRTMSLHICAAIHKRSRASQCEGGWWMELLPKNHGAYHAMQNRYKDRTGEIQRTNTLVSEETGAACPVQKINDCVKYIHRKTRCRKKLIRRRFGELGNTRGYWDESKKTCGVSGCGVVMKAVDREHWITVSRLTSPFESGFSGDVLTMLLTR